jgi:hypothetical protein
MAWPMSEEEVQEALHDLVTHLAAIRLHAELAQRKAPDLADLGRIVSITEDAQTALTELMIGDD